MTAVAACKSADVPILVGDFLISHGDDRNRGRKKIALLQPNIAVGWTGKLLQAEEVLTRLYEKARREKITKESMGVLLSDLQVEGSSEPELKLVGWICDTSGQFGFHWDAGAEQHTWGDDWFVGSGGEAVEEVFKGVHASLDPQPSPGDRNAIKAMLEVLARLNCSDRLTHEGNSEGFGGGYEALYWSATEQKFKYISDVLYFTVVARLNAQGELTEEPEILMDSLMTYRANVVDGFSVLTLSEGDSHDVWAMSAVGMPKSRDALENSIKAQWDQLMDLQADYYGGLLAFAAPLPCPAIPWVACPWHSRNFLKGALGRFEVNIPPELIERAYREGRRAFSSEPRPVAHVRLDHPR